MLLLLWMIFCSTTSVAFLASLLFLHHTRSKVVWNPRSKIFNLTDEYTDSYYVNCTVRVIEYDCRDGGDMTVLM